MVRLVFRPYTQVRASICTSERLRTSTRVSPGFVLPGHSSPSFGSQRPRSVTGRRPGPCGRMMVRGGAAPTLARAGAAAWGSGGRGPSLSLRAGACHPSTRAGAGLLGPCFKTGRRKPLRPWAPFGGRHNQAPRALSVGPRGAHPSGPRKGAGTGSGRGSLRRFQPRCRLESPRPRGAPSAFPPTVSSTVSLSSQSPFHLSLTVLVRYRSPARI